MYAYTHNCVYVYMLHPNFQFVKKNFIELGERGEPKSARKNTRLKRNDISPLPPKTPNLSLSFLRSTQIILMFL